jgi:hypothetical protein
MAFQMQRFPEKTMSKKRKYTTEPDRKRLVSNKTYNKIFFVATEGVRTEPEYFNWLDSVLEKSKQTKIITVPTKNSNSSPKKLKETLQRHLTKNKLRSLDEAWIVCDSDGRTFKVLEPVLTFQNSSNQRHVAITNPKFEYWLLLHFEDGSGVQTSKSAQKDLRNICLL